MNKIKKQYTVNALIISSILFGFSALTALTKQINGIELTVFRSINNWPDNLRYIFLIITQAGSFWMLFGVTLLLLGLKLNRLALRLFSLSAVAFLFTESFKLFIARPRPYAILENVHVRELLQTGNGFPSGHTAIATSTALILWLYLPKKSKWLVWIWILLVGLSRIYLGVHAPLDVVGGFCVGVIVVSISLLIHGKLSTVLKITKLKLQS